MPGIVAWGFARLSVHNCFRFSYQQDHFAKSVFRVGAWSVHDKSDHSCLSGRGQKSHKPPCRLLSLVSPHLNMFAAFVLVKGDFWSRVSPASKTKARCLWDHTDGKSELLFCRCVTYLWLFWMWRWNKRHKPNKRCDQELRTSSCQPSFFLSFLTPCFMGGLENTFHYNVLELMLCVHVFWVLKFDPTKTIMQMI